MEGALVARVGGLLSWMVVSEVTSGDVLEICFDIRWPAGYGKINNFEVMSADLGDDVTLVCYRHVFLYH